MWGAAAKKSTKSLARLEGFEPPTLGLEGRCSIQLSYRRVLVFCGASERDASFSGQDVPENATTNIRAIFSSRTPCRPVGFAPVRGSIQQAGGQTGCCGRWGLGQST